MLTHMKFENRPVHLFNISGRKYYVTRSSAPQTGAVALTSTNGAAAVLAPANMSYEGCTDLLDPLNTRKKEFPEFSEALKRLRFLFKYIGEGGGYQTMPKTKSESTDAGRTLLQIIDQNAADNAKLAEKLNGVAGDVIDTIVKVMQAADTPNPSKLQAAQTLLKARQEVNDRLLKDEEKKRENSFDPFSFASST